MLRPGGDDEAAQLASLRPAPVAAMVATPPAPPAAVLPPQPERAQLAGPAAQADRPAPPVKKRVRFQEGVALSQDIGEEEVELSMSRPRPAGGAVAKKPALKRSRQHGAQVRC
jgi:hypothetical protein